MFQPPEVSICIPVIGEGTRLQNFLQDLTQFFQKFPVSYEVLLGLDPTFDQSRSWIQQKVQEGLPFRIGPESQARDRAQNLDRLFAEGKGKILISYPLDPTLPLGEIFKILQSFFNDADLDAVFTRRARRPHLEKAPPPALESRFEDFFRGLLLEKAHWPFQDPFSPVFAIRKTSFEKIHSDLKPAGWYWTPEVQRALHLRRLKTEEVPVHLGPSSPPKGSRFKESLRLLHFVLFRV